MSIREAKEFGYEGGETDFDKLDDEGLDAALGLAATSPIVEEALRRRPTMIVVGWHGEKPSVAQTGHWG